MQKSSKRPVGYTTSLERAEQQKGVSHVNTDFRGKQHNVIVFHFKGHPGETGNHTYQLNGRHKGKVPETHEHYWYNPKTRSMGWHGENYKTKHNHPEAFSKQKDPQSRSRTGSFSNGKQTGTHPTGKFSEGHGVKNAGIHGSYGKSNGGHGVKDAGIHGSHGNLGGGHGVKDAGIPGSHGKSNGGHGVKNAGISGSHGGSAGGHGENSIGGFSGHSSSDGGHGGSCGCHSSSGGGHGSF